MKFFALRCSALIWIYIDHYIYITDRCCWRIWTRTFEPKIGSTIQWWIISRKVSKKCRLYQMDPVKKSGGLSRRIFPQSDVRVQSGEWGRLNLLWSHFELLSSEGKESTWEHSVWFCEFLYNKNISVLCQWFLLFLSGEAGPVPPVARVKVYRVSCSVVSCQGAPGWEKILI